MRLALFDFDGTLTNKDTLFEYLKFYKGSRKFYIGLLYLSPVLLLFKLGFIRNWRAKEILITYFLGNTPTKIFEESCRNFVQNKLPSLIRQEAFDKLNIHKFQGDEIYIVSASPQDWVGVYADTISVNCIATTLEVVEGKLTGKIQGRNCHGSEKVKRIRERIDLDSFKSIAAYGDSGGDKEMLELANHRFYRKF